MNSISYALIFSLVLIASIFISIKSFKKFYRTSNEKEGLYRKSFFISFATGIVSLFLLLITIFLISLPTVEENQDSAVVKPRPDIRPTDEQSEEQPVFSYDLELAKADASGEFTLDIKTGKGYNAEIDDFETVDEAVLKKVGPDMYQLTGKIDKGDTAGSYYIVFTKGEDVVGERIYIDNDLAYDPKLDTYVPEVATNDGYIWGIKMNVEEVMGEYLEVDSEEVAVIEEVQVNDNAGKKDGTKLILIHLNTPMGLTSNKTQQKIDMQTLEITKAIYQNPSIDFDIDSITYFWSMPIADKEGLIEKVFASKISLERKTLDSLNYDRLKGIDVKQVADQYQSDIK